MQAANPYNAQPLRRQQPTISCLLRSFIKIDKLVVDLIKRQCNIRSPNAMKQRLLSGSLAK